MDSTAGTGLTLDCLRRIHATLLQRRPDSSALQVRSVGFVPHGSQSASPADKSKHFDMLVQYDVQPASESEPVEPLASWQLVRLRDRQSGRYRQLEVKVQPKVTGGGVVPSGVRIDAENDFATTSVVVCWTKALPTPPLPTEAKPDDPRWRWGIISVAHLFAAPQGAGHGAARIARRVNCRIGPANVAGRVVARGRVPGGPDISLIETGLDRLWLSGFIDHIAAPAIAAANESQLLRWISQGADGLLLGNRVVVPWRWQAFYPELAIDGLGKLKHVVSYEVPDAKTTPPPQMMAPLGPGTSGSVIVAGGIPIGLHVAARQPDFRVGYAQSLDLSLAWLKQQTQASHLRIIGLLADEG